VSLLTSHDASTRGGEPLPALLTVVLSSPGLGFIEAGVMVRNADGSGGIGTAD